MRTGRASELSPLLLAAVFAGTAAGSLARWGLGLAIPAGYGMLAVLIVNLVGSFCLGLLLEALAWRQDRMPADWLRLAQRGLGTGLLGGFTTYSTFALELWERVRSGASAAAFGDAVLMLVAGLAAAAAGLAVGAWLRGRRRGTPTAGAAR